MAHKKGQGSSKNGRDSNAQYRGVKLYGGQSAKAGSVIVRQCGTPFHPGYNVKRAKDDTLFALEPGRVVFLGRRVHIDPFDDDATRPVTLQRYRAEQRRKHAAAS